MKYIGFENLYFGEDDDNFSVFPRLDITSDIYLMGDYFSTNYD